MERFKEKWEITKNWQLIHPFLGVFLSLFCGWLIADGIVGAFSLSAKITPYLIILLTLFLTWGIIKICLYCFKKLKNRWVVNARWEFIAIFIAFAITGSTAGRLSNPLMELIGFHRDFTSGWAYWPLRIVLIFPIYQIILLLVGWIFGQYRFFYNFLKKMWSRMGLGFLFGESQK
ncbi:MAG: prolipoprotein diacylglyceryl transferase [Cytophagaceae bacterium]|nr:prolipoprotein diacylglyceryl transferase [Cytophagaceae bacterium]